MIRTVALLGVAHDPQLSALSAALTASGSSVVELNLASLPTITLGEAAADVRFAGKLQPRPDAVFIHPLSVLGGSAVALGLLQRWEHAGSKLYNSPWDAYFVSKPYQMGLLREYGIMVAPTLWTNDRDHAQEASQALGATRLFVEQPGADWQLEPGAPVDTCETLRVLAMDGQILACQTLDPRSLRVTHASSAVHDAEFGQICVRVMQLLRLRMAALDVQRDEGGDYRILDVDASPTFLEMSSLSDEAIATSVARLLLSDRRPPSIAPNRMGENVLRTRVESFEMTVLERALHKARGNQSVAAERLGIPLRTLVHKISKYRLRHVDRAPSPQERD